MVPDPAALTRTPLDAVVTVTAVKVDEVHEGGLAGSLVTDSEEARPGVLVLGGSEGGRPLHMAKLLAAEASWAAADICVQTHGGFGFAEEFDIERKFRETRLYQVAPISTNLILAYLAEHVLGLPRSY